MWYLSRALLLLLGASCGQNVFKDLPDKNSDPYLLQLARQRLDDGEYDNAINAITPVLQSDSRNVDVVYIAAAAYAGRAGLKTLTLFTEIATKTSDGKKLLKILGEHISSASRTATIKDLEIAISILEGYSPNAVDRTPTLNYFGLFLYYAYLGALIHVNAMDGQNNVIGGFDACTVASLPHADVDVMMISFARITDILNVIGNSAAGSIGNQFTYGFPGYDVGCPAAGNATNAAYCKLMRTLVNRDEIGLNTGAACP